MTTTDHPTTSPTKPDTGRAGRAAQGRRPRSHPEVTLVRLIRAEWTKFWTVRSAPLVLLATAAVVLVSGLALAAVTAVQLDSLTAEQRAGLNPVADPFAGFQLAPLMAASVGAVTLGGDIGSGALRTFLVAAPRRGRVLAAKALVLVGAVFAPMLVALAITWTLAQAVYGTVGLGAGAGYGGVIAAVIGGAVALTGAALLGLALAALTRQTTLAIVLVTAVLLVLPGLVGLVPGKAAAWASARLPSTVAMRLVQVQPDGPDQATLDALTRRWAKLHPTEAADGGIVVAVRTADGVTRRSAAGAQPGGMPLTPDSWTYIGSVTKTYVAAALLEAQAKGLVDLDAPVRRYVPDAPGDPGLTVRQLLSLTSGLPDYISTSAWRTTVAAQPERAWTPAEVLSELVPAGFKPPGKYEYSNTNYQLVALVLEKVTGQPWQQVVRDTVLRPLGLTRTDLTGRGHPVVAGLLVNEDKTTARIDPSRYTAVESSAGPAGGMTATASDLAAFGSALLSGKAVPAAQWREMSRFNPDGGYGLGLADFGVVTRTSDGSSPSHAIGNNGEIVGYGAAMLLYPGSGTVVTVLGNSDRVNNFAVAAGLATDLGIDRDPKRVGAAAALGIWLVYSGLALAFATWWFRRRDV